MTRRRIRSLVAAALLCMATQLHALTVSIQTIQPDFCGQSVGMLEALASGGTEPYRFDWYRIEDGTPVLLCSDCSSSAQGLTGGTYKVVVWDEVDDQAEFTVPVYTESLELWEGDIASWPYLASELPYLKIYPSGIFTSFLPYDSVSVSVDGGDLYWEPDPQEGGAWWFTAPVASVIVNITYAYTGGQCTVHTPFEVSPPTVIPEMHIIDVQGSCANAPTGSLTVALSGGQVSDYLYVSLGGWNQSQGQFQQEVVLDGTTTVTIDGLAAGSNTFHLTGSWPTTSSPPEWGFPYLCHDSIEFDIPDLGPTCNVVEGNIFIDTNLDCSLLEGIEPGVPGVILEIQPGDHFSSTDANGDYSLVIPNGAYTAALQSSVVEEHCTTTPIPFTIGDVVTVNMPSISLVSLDASVALASGPARPGFQYSLALSARSLTPAATGAVTVTLDFDPALEFLSANPAPTSVSGNTLTWDQPQLTPFQERTINIRFQVPPNVDLIGTDLVCTASLATANTDVEPLNNTATLVRTVTGSLDPNDKLASTSSRTSDALYIIDTDEWFDYTIRFQNTGTDTAFHVIITDTLASTLDPTTLEVGAASHPFTWQLRDACTLKFRFFDILLPDSNVNEPASHGFVSFRIRPRLPLLPGTLIENTANIYFDFNEPVITEPSVLIAEFSTGTPSLSHTTLQVMPNPASEMLYVMLPANSTGALQVFAIDGRMVEAPITRRLNSMEVDVRALSQGTYMMRTAEGSAWFVKR